MAPTAAAGVGALVLVLLFGWAARWLEEDELPSFRDQACSLPEEWLERIERGHFPEHSGDISLLPKQPAYMASGAGGWSHSGPWDYLQRVPLVFYGPGVVDEGVEVDGAVTLADVAPTVAGLLRGAFKADGRRLDEVADFSPGQLRRDPPALVLTIVWDGGGWNTLDQWPDAWPNLGELIANGVSYRHATVGSSPSVTPSVHTTLGTGLWPATHGISGIPVRNEDGEVVDSFLKGESSRFLQVPTFAERWDEQNHNRALIGMVGYEPWHLGMIGQGAERPTGDRDQAAWLDIETNEWITNPNHYVLPDSLVKTGGLEDDIAELDARDGQVDGAWRTREILHDPARLEETPAFIRYHARALMNLIKEEGYGSDDVTDFIFTNFKQIDRVGHYFSMHSEEVRDSVVESDAQLGELVDFLDREVGRGRYVVVVTADHGQQPNEDRIDGYGINPTELEEDIKDEFGPIIRGIWPTEAFLFPQEMAERDVTVEEVARFIGEYRVQENSPEGDTGLFGVGDRLFAAAVPSSLLEGGIAC
ncbi:MAG: alkaline phosphatase family protein [Actinomycetota bacterium]|nr:alkaline phosphatase family protein [Actinomycetota bacterium]